MKKKNYSFLALIFLFCWLFLFPTSKSVSAQGTYACKYNEIYPNQCKYLGNYCAPEYEPGYCREWDGKRDQCLAIPAGHPCIPKMTCDPGTGNQLDGASTAIGCIPINNLTEFVSWLLSKLIFIASGIAFLIMAIGAIQIITSAGNPDKVKGGSELITSALSGLVFIILSVFLLKLIGVDILHIPGL